MLKLPVGAGIGATPALEAVSLVGDDTESEQCVRFIAPQSGEVVFAINDRDFSNNRGSFDFEFKVEPALEELVESNSVFPCEDGTF